MKLQNKNDNAANRKSYVGKVYNLGEKQEKIRFLKVLILNGQNYIKKDTFIFMI